ncbi:MAG: dehydrogenase [Planctomycetes bacterium]|nr:dehydrogenase [Planctomycetota bacterium]
MFLSACLFAVSMVPPAPQDDEGESAFLGKGDTIALLGSALAERMQHAGWFETYLHLLAPEENFTVRNLGFAADELTVRQRTQGFGSPEDHLTLIGADVVLLFFGFVESFRGEEGLSDFEQDFEEYLDRLAQAKFNGQSAPRVALISPIPYAEPGLDSPPGNWKVAELVEANRRLEPYRGVVEEVARKKGVLFLDAWSHMKSANPSTIDGIHLDDAGNKTFGSYLARTLLGREILPRSPLEDAVRRAVLQKNLYWFNRYRATDGYNVYGGRSSLRYKDDLANYDVLQRELEVLDAMAANLDRVIWSSLSTGDPKPTGRVEVPEKIAVKTNRPGFGTEERPYLSGEKAIEKMTLPEGLQVELFADEKRFPEIANPVQMAFDTRGRLWVAAWPTYPHWEPGTAMDDRLVILEDHDGDGRADESKIFAGGLHNPTGFEFWNGGVYLAQQPDLMFLRDDNDDDRADHRERVLGAFSSGDTHHAINSFVFGPGGGLYFQEGTFHQTQLETPHGPVRSRNACAWRFDPRTWRVERYVAYNFANPHGHVFDAWGQDFITDGTGNVNYYALPFSGHLPEPLKHQGYFSFFKQRSRPAAATEFLSSGQFPPEFQNNYLIANVIGFQGIFRYRIEDDGSGFQADELEPLIQSSDPNFRPVDLEVGPDGALYFLDWQAPLIGHMQHHLRDPNRDHEHGRIYRIRARDRALLKSPQVSVLSTAKLIDLLKDPQDRLRSRARIELSNRPFKREAVQAFLANIDPEDPLRERHRLEALWLYQRNGQVSLPLLDELLNSPRHEARAAATRVVRQMRREIPIALDLLEMQIGDKHARVRLEALVALSHFTERGELATEIALSVLDHPRDKFIDYALEETLRSHEVSWRAALLERPAYLQRTPRGLALLLDRLNPEELARVPASTAVHEAVLRRRGMAEEAYDAAVRGLAAERNVRPDQLLFEAIRATDDATGAHVDHTLMTLFALLSENATAETAPTLASLRQSAKRKSTRRLAGAAALRLADVDGLTDLLGEAKRTSVTMLDFLESLALTDPLKQSEGFQGWVATHLSRELLRRMDEPRRGIDLDRLSGRYVRIELPGESRTLTLAEVQVFEDGANISGSGTATQSTVNWGGVASRAIDGITSPHWSDGGQTHTMENRPNPWWELDLGSERRIDEIVLWNRVENDNRDLSLRLDDFEVRILDTHRRTTFEFKAGAAPFPSVSVEVVPPDAQLRRASALALAHVLGEGAIPLLVKRVGDHDQRASALAGLSRIGIDKVAAESSETLSRFLLGFLEDANGQRFDSADERALLSFADDLAAYLPHDGARELRRSVRRLGPQTVVIRTISDSLLFDRKEFTVVASRPVELVFENTDIMPHNLVVAAIGALAKVGLAAEAMALAGDAWDLAYVPQMSEVLHATGLLQPGASQVLSFDAPSTAGDYPFVCTFPGHWARMNGTMRVVASEEEREILEAAYKSDPIAETILTEPGRAFVKAWKFADLRAALKTTPAASPTGGLAILEAASCTRCHRIDGQGGLSGPPLEEAVAKYELPELLNHILEPSGSIDEGYRTEIVELTDATLAVGRIVFDRDGILQVQENPYDSETVTEILAEDVQHRTPSQVSSMPTGLLNTFEKAEILTLLAFLESLRPEEEN